MKGLRTVGGYSCTPSNEMSERKEIFKAIDPNKRLSEIHCMFDLFEELKRNLPVADAQI